MVRRIWKDLVIINGPSAQMKDKLLMNAAVLTCSGQYQVTIENYRTIRCLTETDIEVQSRTCRIKVKGKDLRVAYYTREVMKIKGQIESIEYILPEGEKYV